MKRNPWKRRWAVVMIVLLLAFASRNVVRADWGWATAELACALLWVMLREQWA